MKRFSCGLLILSILLLSLTGTLAEPVTDDVPGTVSCIHTGKTRTSGTWTT